MFLISDMIASFLARMTRRRLREAHARADELLQSMDRFYQREHRRRHWRSITALVHILVELCQDGILCDKLANGQLFSMDPC